MPTFALSGDVILCSCVYAMTYSGGDLGIAL